MSLGTILVVDDEEDILSSIRLILDKAGYHVVTAEDGEKAIVAMRFGERPLMVDTIILDLHMPKVNGMEATAYFRSQFPSVPIIILTGHPSKKSALEVFQQGIVKYLVKPVDEEKLKAAVAKAVKQHALYKDRFMASRTIATQ
jgi:two-component system, chemotaxis family, chemotaxis protein CheY